MHEPHSECGYTSFDDFLNKNQTSLEIFERRIVEDGRYDIKDYHKYKLESAASGAGASRLEISSFFSWSGSCLLYTSPSPRDS